MIVISGFKICFAQIEVIYSAVVTSHSNLVDVVFSRQLPENGQESVFLQLQGCVFGGLSCWLIDFLFCTAMMFPMLGVQL